MGGPQSPFSAASSEFSHVFGARQPGSGSAAAAGGGPSCESEGRRGWPPRRLCLCRSHRPDRGRTIRRQTMTGHRRRVTAPRHPMATVMATHHQAILQHLVTGHLVIPHLAMGHSGPGAIPHPMATGLPAMDPRHRAMDLPAMATLLRCSRPSSLAVCFEGFDAASPGSRCTNGPTIWDFEVLQPEAGMPKKVMDTVRSMSRS